MVNISNIEKTRQLVRKLQMMMFEETVEKKELFPITLEIEKLLDQSSVDFNKLLEENKK